VAAVARLQSGKGRDVPLSDDALSAFKAQRHLCGPLVFSAEDGRMLGTRSRRTWRCAACRFKAVQELLGHATMDVTMRYAHLSPNVPRDAVKALDSGVASAWHPPAIWQTQCRK
jgi:integrase